MESFRVLKMSQLFGRISKLSSALNRRSFSTTPYLYLGREVVGESPCGGNVVNFNLYDPRKEEQAVIENQTLSKHLCESSRIGSSRGWLAMMNKRDSTVRLTNILNNNPSKTISLPRLIKDETERLIYVSVSSNDHGCVAVASARSDGSRLSMCRLGDSEWTLSTCLAVQSSVYHQSCTQTETGSSTSTVAALTTPVRLTSLLSTVRWMPTWDTLYLTLPSWISDVSISTSYLSSLLQASPSSFYGKIILFRLYTVRTSPMTHCFDQIEKPYYRYNKIEKPYYRIDIVPLYSTL